MKRATYAGNGTRFYPETIMYSAESGERVLMAEPWHDYDFPDVVVVADDGTVSQESGVAPQDGFWVEPDPANPKPAAAPAPDAGPALVPVADQLAAGVPPEATVTLADQRAGVPLVFIPTSTTSTPED